MGLDDLPAEMLDYLLDFLPSSAKQAMGITNKRIFFILLNKVDIETRSNHFQGKLLRKQLEISSRISKLETDLFWQKEQLNLAKIHYHNQRGIFFAELEILRLHNSISDISKKIKSLKEADDPCKRKLSAITRIKSLPMVVNKSHLKQAGFTDSSVSQISKPQCSSLM